ncbi:hypothetical protein EA462_02660 [Natrarchaeobius halalkaliphilus]|uniref:Potassium transporter TrkA n=1 Tax=Natrarchaeobius halalkaliphilus TaxID=1679091 RepID=A0A3N6LT05_9EURY|nr:hypothetical protein [Natrarchaeobius halalkaliphilus]RQG93123.1 hypothetical protein EA462_02660 [Natrarchaeobius halalkaliphilus]
MIEVTTEIIVGVAFGLVVAIGPAIAVGTLGAAGAYLGRGLSRPESVAIALSLAVGNGYAIGVVGPQIIDVRTQTPRLLVATAIVALLAMYANSLGARIASELPIGSSFPLVRNRSLSPESLESVDASGQVTIQSTGDVRDIEGYPPLSPRVRHVLEQGSWRVPADLSLPELERRLEQRLRTTENLAAVSVSIDGTGRATIAAAPPASEVASRVPDGWRAVSVPALVPSGAVPGEEIVVYTRDGAVTGSLLETNDGDRIGRVNDGTIGGEKCVTVAVPIADAESVLRTDRCRLGVRPQRASETVEALALLERADCSIGRVTGGELTAILEDDHERADVWPIVADSSESREVDTERPRQWVVEPAIADLATDDDVFVVAESLTVDRIREGNESTASSASSISDREIESTIPPAEPEGNR